MGHLFIGIDVGSSSVKTSIFDAARGVSIGKATYPRHEQRIDAPQPGWAEQDPDMWWAHFQRGYAEIVQTHNINTRDIDAIGISYQMHGLVLVDADGHPLRKSIIWCDSRAVDTGAAAFAELGEQQCLSTVLNSPGNFTASKLKWVQDHEPALYDRAVRFMLPGDYIAMRLSGETTTTATGLSEGVLWNFPERRIADMILNHYSIDRTLVPDLVPAIGAQVTVSPDVGYTLGLRDNVKVTYRAGDQPNNALSLNVLHPGQIAATAGTSGVIYAVTDQDVYDDQSRINTFLHVNDTPVQKRNGILICVNGTGILYSWLKRLLSRDTAAMTYPQLNAFAGKAPVGSGGLCFFPFGNGAERIFENRQLQANVLNLDFNRHETPHLIRAGMEGIVFALNLGFDILKSKNVPYETIRAGHANLFLSKTFREIFANVTESVVELYETDGAEGAARAAALGAGFYTTEGEAFASLTQIDATEPRPALVDAYAEAYGHWNENLNRLIA